METFRVATILLPVPWLDSSMARQGVETFRFATILLPVPWLQIASQADTAAPVCRRLAQDGDFLHDFFKRSDSVSGFIANVSAN